MEGQKILLVGGEPVGAQLLKLLKEAEKQNDVVLVSSNVDNKEKRVVMIGSSIQGIKEDCLKVISNNLGMCPRSFKGTVGELINDGVLLPKKEKSQYKGARSGGAKKGGKTKWPNSNKLNSQKLKGRF